MSLINVNGQNDQNQAEALAKQLMDLIQSAPDSQEKVNFIRDLADKLGIQAGDTQEQVDAYDEEEEEEVHVDYCDEHDLKCYDNGHDDIEQRGKLVFIDDQSWDEDFAHTIFDDDPNSYCCCDFDDVSNGQSIDIDSAINNVDDAIEELKAVKQTLKRCQDNGGKYVIWNNDDDFDYETGDPEDI